jgi:heavy metal translocating P-type ATPase
MTEHATRLTTGCACASAQSPDGTLWRLAVGAFVAINSMVLALAVNTSGPAPDTNVVRYVLATATAGVLVLLGGPLGQRAARELRAGQITIELLFLLGIGGAIGISVLTQYNGSGPVYYEVANILLVIYSFGRHLTASAQGRVRGLLAESFPGIDSCEVLDGDGIYREVRVEDVRVGQRVRVHPGRPIPVDGTVCAGAALARESHMTGESFAVGKKPGDRVLAGSYVLDATLLVKVSAPGCSRQIDQIEDLLLRAQAHPGKSQRIANLIAARFVPVVSGIAGITFLIWWQIDSLQSALFNSLSVLLVACPCALGFATPIALWATLARLSGGGVTLKNGAALEELASIHVAIFDKTGTLTDPDEGTGNLQLLPGARLAAQEVMDCITAAEAASDHPIARAIASLARDQRVAGNAVEVQVLPGVGLEAQIQLRSGEPCHTVRIGLLPWLERRGASAGLIGIEIDGIQTAILRLEERQREGIKSAVSKLKKLGVRTVLLSGDSAERSNQIAIPERLAGLSPEQKLAYVGEEQRNGRRVLFVGDGINDSAAMAASDVSLAPDSASPLATAIADGIWSDRSLDSLIAAIEASRQAARIIRSNLWIAIAYNSVGIGLAAFGFIHPVMAALLMTGSSLTVTWRALQLVDSPIAGVTHTPIGSTDEVLA